MSSNTEIDPSMRDVEVGIASGVSVAPYPSSGVTTDRADSLLDVMRNGADVFETCMQRSSSFMRQHDDKGAAMV